MHDGVEAPLGEQSIQETLVRKIADDQLRAAVNGQSMPAALQEIEHDDAMARLT